MIFDAPIKRFIMKMQFLGATSQCDQHANFYNSNVIISQNNTDRVLLLDCGTDIKQSLYHCDMHFDVITDVYISHLHADHVGGLEWLCLLKRYSSKKEKLHLWISKDLVVPLWENTLKGGLEYLTDEIGRLDTFFYVHSIDKTFAWQGINFTLAKCNHISGPRGLMPCYGLFIENDKHKIFFTGDTKFIDDERVDCMRKANLIFHDAETTIPPSGVHAHYNEIKLYPAEIKKKIWLYHYNALSFPETFQSDGFRGVVKQGQVFSFS